MLGDFSNAILRNLFARSTCHGDISSRSKQIEFPFLGVYYSLILLKLSAAHFVIRQFFEDISWSLHSSRNRPCGEISLTHINISNGLHSLEAILQANSLYHAIFTSDASLHLSGHHFRLNRFSHPRSV